MLLHAFSITLFAYNKIGIQVPCTCAPLHSNLPMYFEISSIYNPKRVDDSGQPYFTLALESTGCERPFGVRTYSIAFPYSAIMSQISSHGIPRIFNLCINLALQIVSNAFLKSTKLYQIFFPLAFPSTIPLSVERWSNVEHFLQKPTYPRGSNHLPLGPVAQLMFSCSRIEAYSLASVWPTMTIIGGKIQVTWLENWY